MFVLRMVLKNSLRHKLRFSLTILGIAVAVIAFCLMRTVVTTWYAGVEASAADRLITRQSVSFIYPLPYSYRDQIARVNGVKNVSYANWFGGTYIDKKNFFARIAVDADTYFQVYPELLVPPDEMKAFQQERNACIVGTDLVKRFGFKLGDVVQIEGDIFPGTWQFVVRGIYTPRDQATDPSTFLFRWDYLDEKLRQDAPVRAGWVGWYVVQVKSGANTAEVSQSIDNLFAKFVGRNQDRDRATIPAGVRRCFQLCDSGHEFHFLRDHRHHHAGPRQHDDHVIPRTHPRVRCPQDTRVLGVPSPGPDRG